MSILLLTPLLTALECIDPYILKSFSLKFQCKTVQFQGLGFRLGMKRNSPGIGISPTL
jgi:hypothetical protein